MSNNIRTFAEKELELIGYNLNDIEEGPNKWVKECILELLDVFSKQGHSGSSAPYCIRLFSKLAMFEPLSQLTGEDNEWIKVAEGVFQNSRCSHVFKENNQAYDSTGIIFRDKDGCYYQDKNSRVNITFPYTPNTKFVDK